MKHKTIRTVALILAIIFLTGYFFSDRLFMWFVGGKVADFIPYKLIVHGGKVSESYPPGIGEAYFISGYTFYKSFFGRNVVYGISYENRVAKISELRYVKCAQPYHLAFVGAEGKKLIDLIKIAGPPTQNGVGGLPRAIYETHDGYVYILYLGNDDIVSDVLLSKNGESVNLAPFQTRLCVTWSAIAAAVILCASVLLILKKKGILFKKKHVESQ